MVLDEDMNHRLAHELTRRGLDATSMRDLGLANQGIKDGALLKALSSHSTLVLVTWDNKMVKGHRSQLLHFGTTLAVVDRSADHGGLNEEQVLPRRDP